MASNLFKTTLICHPDGAADSPLLEPCIPPSHLLQSSEGSFTYTSLNVWFSSLKLFDGSPWISAKTQHFVAYRALPTLTPACISIILCFQLLWSSCSVLSLLKFFEIPCHAVISLTFQSFFQLFPLTSQNLLVPRSPVKQNLLGEVSLHAYLWCAILGLLYKLLVTWNHSTNSKMQFQGWCFSLHMVQKKQTNKHVNMQIPGYPQT